MFTKTIAYIQNLLRSADMPEKQVDAIGGLGVCNTPLEHRGTLKLTAPSFEDGVLQQLTPAGETYPNIPTHYPFQDYQFWLNNQQIGQYNQGGVGIYPANHVYGSLIVVNPVGQTDRTDSGAVTTDVVSVTNGYSAWFGGPVFITDLMVGGDTHIDGNTYIEGDTFVGGDTNFEGDTTYEGDTTFNITNWYITIGGTPYQFVKRNFVTAVRWTGSVLEMDQISCYILLPSATLGGANPEANTTTIITPADQSLVTDVEWSTPSITHDKKQCKVWSAGSESTDTVITAQSITTLVTDVEWSSPTLTHDYVSGVYVFGYSAGGTDTVDTAEAC